MAAQGSVKDSFTFVGGLNTEGGFFVTPENTFKEGTNLIPQLDGSIERRNSIDYEENRTLFAAGITTDQKDTWAFTSGIWTTVGGSGNRDFIVAQVGRYLYFYNAATGVVSGNKKSFSVDLNTYKAAGNPLTIGTTVCSFASTYGRLIVTSGVTDPILIEYNPTTDNISVSVISIQIRDFKGKDTGEAVDAEYTDAEWVSLGQTVADVTYNLENQGWNTTLINTYKTANASRNPANSKQWIYGKDTNDDFSASFLNKQDFGNSPAPKGHFLVSAFENTTSRPTSCAFFAGRVWYGGVSNTELLGNIYFSAVLDDLAKVGYAYQTNDPTSEVLSDLEADDGGVIQIPEAGEIVALQTLGRGILALATNGVWFITAIDVAFSAATYSVERITSIGCINAKSIVSVEDGLVYWSNSGIYSVQAGTTGAELSATNISDTNIKSFYNAIPVLNKLYAEGVYNSTEKVITWAYSTQEIPSSGTGRYNKTALLSINVKLQSWYTYTIDTTTGPVPVSIDVTKETSDIQTVYGVLVGEDNIIAGVDEVVANIATLNSSSKLFKLLTLHPTGTSYSVTFADFENTRTNNTKFNDWYTFNDVGAEKEAYMLTGYNAGANGPARQMSAMYLSVFMKRTETAFDASTNPLNESGCLMQSRFDFTDNSVAGKWAANVQVYKPPRMFFAEPSTEYVDGYPLVISKNKIRGRGKAVQFKFGSDAGRNMKIVGWTTQYVGNTNV